VSASSVLIDWDVFFFSPFCRNRIHSFVRQNLILLYPRLIRFSFSTILIKKEDTALSVFERRNPKDSTPLPDQQQTDSFRELFFSTHMSNHSPKKKKYVRLSHSVKLVLLGDSGVGKTSIALRFVHNSYHPFVEATIGATYLSRNVALPETDERRSPASPRRAVELKIWDTAGQERYQSLTPLYFRGAGAALLVYDITKLHSYQTLQRWVRELKHTGPENVLLTIVGNKADLNQERTVSREDAEAYAESIGAVYMEVSAKTGENMTEVFDNIATRVSQEDRFIRPPDGTLPTDSLDLSARQRYIGTSCCYWFQKLSENQYANSFERKLHLKPQNR